MKINITKSAKRKATIEIPEEELHPAIIDLVRAKWSQDKSLQALVDAADLDEFSISFLVDDHTDEGTVEVRVEFGEADDEFEAEL